MPKHVKSRKLHYGKYLYKATFFNILCYAFSSYRNSSKDRLSFARSVIERLEEQQASHREMSVEVWRAQKLVSTSEFTEGSNILSLLESHDDWRVRVEMNRYMTIYTSDETLIDGLAQGCGAREIHKPEEGIENFLLLNIDTAVVNKPPEYDYRVYLKGNRVDPSFANWLEANADKSRIGKQSLNNIKHGWISSGNYFYIKNDKVLTMVRMIIGHNIRRVEKMIYKGDIDKYMHASDE